jgi:hypothetical protein
VKLSKSRITEIIQEEIEKKNRIKKNLISENDKEKSNVAPGPVFGPGYADMSEEQIGLALRAWGYIAVITKKTPNMIVRPPTKSELDNAQTIWKQNAETGWDRQLNTLEEPGLYPSSGKKLVDEWPHWAGLTFGYDNPEGAMIQFAQQNYNFSAGQLLNLEKVVQDVVNTKNSEAEPVIALMETCADQMDTDIVGLTTLEDMRNIWRILAGTINSEEGQGLEKTALLLKVYAYRRLGMNVPTAKAAALLGVIGGTILAQRRWWPRNLMAKAKLIFPKTSYQKEANRRLTKAIEDATKQSLAAQKGKGIKLQPPGAVRTDTPDLPQSSIGGLLLDELGGPRSQALAKMMGLLGSAASAPFKSAAAAGWKAIFHGGIIVIPTTIASSFLEAMAPTLLLYMKYDSVQDMDKLATDIKNQSDLSLYGRDEEFAAYRDSAYIVAKKIAAAYGKGGSGGGYGKAQALKDLADLKVIKTGASLSGEQAMDSVEMYKTPPCMDLVDKVVGSIKSWFSDLLTGQPRTLDQDLTSKMNYNVWQMEDGSFEDDDGNKLGDDGTRPQMESLRHSEKLLRKLIHETAILNEWGFVDSFEAVLYQGGNIGSADVVVPEAPPTYVDEESAEELSPEMEARTDRDLQAARRAPDVTVGPDGEVIVNFPDVKSEPEPKADVPKKRVRSFESRTIKKIQKIVYPDADAKHTGKWEGIELDPGWWTYIDKNWNPDIHGKTPWATSSKDIKWPVMVDLLETKGITEFTSGPKGALRFIIKLRDNEAFDGGIRIARPEPVRKRSGLGIQHVGKVTDPVTGLVTIVKDEGKIHQAELSSGFNINLPRPTDAGVPPESQDYQPPLHGGVKKIRLQSSVPREVTTDNLSDFEIIINPMLGGLIKSITSDSKAPWKQRIIIAVMGWLMSRSQNQLDDLFKVSVDS